MCHPEEALARLSLFASCQALPRLYSAASDTDVTGNIVAWVQDRSIRRDF